jgi:hypothetical protein
MTNTNRKEEKKEASILRHPKQGEASELYWACRKGDLDTVKQIVATTNFIDINRLEPNGSTALHAATYFGHRDVVHFLLHEKGVARHRRNRHGYTAYQESPNNNIRQLYDRPLDNQRFFSSTESKQLFSVPIQPDDQEIRAQNHEEPNSDQNIDEIPNNWVVGANSTGDMRLDIFLQYVLAMGMTSKAKRLFSKLIIRLIIRSDIQVLFAKLLQEYLDVKITINDPQYQLASSFISKYRETKCVEHLIKLYTLECPFYKTLGYGNETAILYLPLIWKLHTLKNRSFTGRSYRGLQMNRKDLQAYQWGLQNNQRIITTQSFCSTSVVEQVALGFANNQYLDDNDPNNIRVLMVMDFPVKCTTAIQLYQTSDNTECLSNYEQEREVLLLPGTMFRVTNIDTIGSLHIIYMVNVLAEWKPELIFEIMTRDTVIDEFNEIFKKILMEQ